MSKDNRNTLPSEVCALTRNAHAVLRARPLAKNVHAALRARPGVKVKLSDVQEALAMATGNRTWRAVLALEGREPELLSRDQYLAFQRELEMLEKASAEGHDTEGADRRIKLLDAVMDASPWTMHPDYGCVAKTEVAPLDAREKVSQQLRNRAKQIAGDGDGAVVMAAAIREAARAPTFGEDTQLVCRVSLEAFIAIGLDRDQAGDLRPAELRTILGENALEWLQTVQAFNGCEGLGECIQACELVEVSGGAPADLEDDFAGASVQDREQAQALASALWEALRREHAQETLEDYCVPGLDADNLLSAGVHPDKYDDVRDLQRAARRLVQLKDQPGFARFQREEAFATQVHERYLKLR